MKAYKIQTKIDSGFSIYIAENAGSAKTRAVSSMCDSYRDANYSWVTSCRRAPEFEYLALNNENSCVAWSSEEGERWQIDRGHWWHGSDVAPNTVCTPTNGGLCVADSLPTPATIGG